MNSLPRSFMRMFSRYVPVAKIIGIRWKRKYSSRRTTPGNNGAPENLHDHQRCDVVETGVGTFGSEYLESIAEGSPVFLEGQDFSQGTCRFQWVVALLQMPRFQEAIPSHNVLRHHALPQRTVSLRCFHPRRILCLHSALTCIYDRSIQIPNRDAYGRHTADRTHEHRLSCWLINVVRV